VDFIFGTWSTDELKLVHHRATRRGLQHHGTITPRDPQPGQPVIVDALAGGDFHADHAALYYTTDGTTPDGSRGVAANGIAVLMECREIEWDSISWAYLTHWRGMIPAQPDGAIVHYRISAWTEGGEETFANFPDSQQIIEMAASNYFKKKPIDVDFTPGNRGGEVFTYHVDSFRPPQWAKDAIIYHIFVDRFYPGDGKTWIQTDDLNGFCGGTLWGVIEKLDYIQDLGVNCIWLSPTWESPSHHGYDVTDYCKTESRLGGDEALRALIKAAHERGIRVLLDLVCNHISNENPIFQEALNDKNSRYRDWFIWNDSPIGYRTFFAVESMPQVNLTNPGAKAWMLDIARYWMSEFDADGYRLDYANGPNPQFWWEFRAACREVKPDSYIFGEVVEAPDNIAHYIGRLDGCLDFHIGEALRKTFGWKTMSEKSLNEFVARHKLYFPTDFVMPSFVDNHDMDRFLWIADGDRDALRRAATVQMSLPNPPIIYYGTEVGLNQNVSTHEGGLHMSRTPMLWDDEQDHDLLTFYKKIIAARRK